VVVARVFVLFILLLACCSDIVHAHITSFWDLLRSTQVFRSVYFETLYAPFVYTIILIFFGLLRMNLRLDCYQIDPKSHLVPNRSRFSFQAFFYLLPLLFLDTFTIKEYPHSPPLPKGTYFMYFLWAENIQTTRSLPTVAPSVFEMIFQSLLATILFDLFFSVTHFILHQVPLLYTYVHKMHHAHERGVTPDFTAELHFLENIPLVLQANIALKVVGAHPLTRFFYIPCLIFALIDNHSGYDFPFNYDKLIPFGIVGGSKQHFLHHKKNNSHYQPFFDYLDPVYCYLQSLHWSFLSTNKT